MSGIKLTVNGDERSLERPQTVTELLTELGFDPRAVAVEYNGEIVKRATYAETTLDEGDRLEIVRFVQGG